MINPELKRLHDVCSAIGLSIEDGNGLDPMLLAELRESIKAFGQDGNVRKEPPEIDPGAIGSDILSALDEDAFRDSYMTTAQEAASYLWRTNLFSKKHFEWSKAHAKLAVIHNKTLAILAVEK